MRTQTSNDNSSNATTSKAAKPKSNSASAKKPLAEKANSSNPPYLEMIKEALDFLIERNGSSRQEIQKFVAEKYDLDLQSNAVSSRLKIALKKGLEKGSWTQTKGSGAQGSFKLAAEQKKIGSRRLVEPEKKPTDRTRKASPVKKSSGGKVARRTSPKKAAEKGGKGVPAKAVGVTKKAAAKNPAGKGTTSTAPTKMAGSSQATRSAKKAVK